MSFREIFSSSRSKLVAAACALALGTGATPALAVPLSVGTDIAVTYDQPLFLLPDLTATLDLTVESITNSKIVLGVDIANTTSPFLSSARLTGLGWNTSPLPTGASDTSSVFNVFLSQNFPTNSSINLCLSSGSNCAGGGRGGLSPLQSNSFTLTLLGNFGASTIDFSNFSAKFQTSFGSFEPQGTITSSCTGTCGSTGGGTGGTGGGTGGGSSVPEPSTLSLLAVALFCGLTYRLAARRAAQKAVPVPSFIEVRS